MTLDGDDDLQGLRRAGRVVAEALAAARAHIRPGQTTSDLDAVCRDVFQRHGARSAPNAAYGFPGTICVSVNEEAVHGIPGLRPIMPGDLVKVDVTAELDGYVADAAVSIAMPAADDTKRRLGACAEEALAAALAVTTSGVRSGRVGRAVERVTRRRGFHVLREVGGHGVGRAIHEPPSIPNWDDPSARAVLHEGLVVAIEPIIASGSGRLVQRSDGWTLATSDGSPAAHAEHTVVVTRGRPMIVTAPDDR